MSSKDCWIRHPIDWKIQIFRATESHETHTESQPRGENQNDNGAWDCICRQKIMLFLPRCYFSLMASVSHFLCLDLAPTWWHSTAQLLLLPPPQDTPDYARTVQISPSSAQMQIFNLLGREYYLKSWVWMGEEHDISFLLFFSPSKPIWEHPRPFSPGTEPFSWADCNTEIM